MAAAAVASASAAVAVAAAAGTAATAAAATAAAATGICDLCCYHPLHQIVTMSGHLRCQVNFVLITL